MWIKTESRANYFEDNCIIRLDAKKIKNRLRNWGSKLNVLWIYKVGIIRITTLCK